MPMATKPSHEVENLKQKPFSHIIQTAIDARAHWSDTDPELMKNLNKKSVTVKVLYCCIYSSFCVLSS